jgi:arsenate reductase
MQITIYHNPDCSTSRTVLGMIRGVGVEPQVIEYMKTPLSREALKTLIASAGLTVREALRTKGTLYGELGLDNRALDDEALLDAMHAHPELINRPFVVTPEVTLLCRPSERVLEILPTPGWSGYCG